MFVDQATDLACLNCQKPSNSLLRTAHLSAVMALVLRTDQCMPARLSRRCAKQSKHHQQT